MKKFFLIILSCVLLLAATGCDTTAAGAPADTASQSGEGTTSTLVNSKGAIGVSMAEDNAFNSDFIAEFTRLTESEGYSVIAKTAGNSSSKQTEDILQLITSEVKIMVVDAVNIDELEHAMDECDNNKIPVYSLLKPINDETKMLISPDYKEMGKMAGEAAKTLLASGGKVKGNVLMLQGNYDSFLMQMYHDGFKEALPASGDVTQTAPYCDYDETKAYEAVKQALASGKPVDLIFSQSESMAIGAIKALEESKAAAKIVTIGADADIIKAITENKITVAIYFSPIELAQKTMLYTQKLLNNQTPLPKYTGLQLGKADAQNAAGLVPEGKKYASIPGVN